ncbi:hypothetical protein MKW92_024554 [Papaver armeniacum]|nr:hypothetical protein MKW92_024554 [Papaver armeniacum]
MRKLRSLEKLCRLLGVSSHNRLKIKGSLTLFGFGFVLGASILLLTTIIFMFPSISLSLMNPMLQNSANIYIHIPSFGHNRHSNSNTSSTGTTTASVDTSITTNSTSSFPPELLKNSSSNNQSNTKRGEKSFNNSSLVLADLPGGDSVNTNDNFIASVSNFSGSSSSSTGLNDAKKQEKSCDSSDGDCDIFEGEWVRDVNRKPYYPPGSCPFVEHTFACYHNGRPDDQFLQWQWQWQSKQTNARCNNIPSILNATDFLERLRGKKLVYVGDSLNRNMFVSMLCILWTVIPDKSRVFRIPKTDGYAMRFEDYNCTVAFVWSAFLVDETKRNTRINKMATPGTETLRLDLIDEVASSMYHDADVIVFDSMHWWTGSKTNNGINYFQDGNYVYPKLSMFEAYKKGLTTWRRWIDKNIDSNRTQIVFRGYSIPHYVGGKWNTGGKCNRETEPIMSNEKYKEMYPSQVKILNDALRQMKTPVLFLNISKLSYYRADAHPSVYGKDLKTAEEKNEALNHQDCIHWCLPGVPDTWNELLYVSLLKAGKGSFGHRKTET